MLLYSPTAFRDLQSWPCCHAAMVIVDYGYIKQRLKIRTGRRRMQRQWCGDLAIEEMGELVALKVTRFMSLGMVWVWREVRLLSHGIVGNTCNQFRSNVLYFRAILVDLDFGNYRCIDFKNYASLVSLMLHKYRCQILTLEEVDHVVRGEITQGYPNLSLLVSSHLQLSFRYWRWFPIPSDAIF